MQSSVQEALTLFWDCLYQKLNAYIKEARKRHYDACLAVQLLMDQMISTIQTGSLSSVSFSFDYCEETEPSSCDTDAWLRGIIPLAMEKTEYHAVSGSVYDLNEAAGQEIERDMGQELKDDNRNSNKAYIAGKVYSEGNAGISSVTAGAAARVSNSREIDLHIAELAANICEGADGVRSTKTVWSSQEKLVEV